MEGHKKESNRSAEDLRKYYENLKSDPLAPENYKAAIYWQVRFKESQEEFQRLKKEEEVEETTISKGEAKKFVFFLREKRNAWIRILQQKRKHIWQTDTNVDPNAEAMALFLGNLIIELEKL